MRVFATMSTIGCALSLSLLDRVAAESQLQEVELASAGNDCSPGYTKLTTPQGCRVATIQLSLPSGFQDTEDLGDWPGGCYHCDSVGGCGDGSWFNYADPGAANGDATPICAVAGWEDNLTVETLFIGDSDIERWESTSSNYPNSINVGVGGYTCDDVNGIIDANLEYFNPAWVVIVCGENDLASGTSVENPFQVFQLVIQKILGSGARALYLGTKPEPSTKSLHSKYNQYDAKIWDHADALSTSLASSSPPFVVVDVHAAFLDLGNPRSFYDNDKLHLSSDGYEYWNTWTTTALAGSGCIRWKNNVCDVTSTTTTSTSTAATATQITTATTIAPQDVKLAAAGNSCPDGYTKLSTSKRCQDAMGQLSLSHSNFQGTENEQNWPGGCYYCSNVQGCSNGVWFNSHGVGATNGGAQPICVLLGDDVCANDTNWTWTTKSGRVKNCRWVANRPDRRCGKMGDDGITSAEDACPGVCNEAC